MLKKLFNKGKVSLPSGTLHGYKDELHEFVGIITVIGIAIIVFVIFRDQIGAIAESVIEWVTEFFTANTEVAPTPTPTPQ